MLAIARTAALCGVITLGFSAPLLADDLQDVVEGPGKQVIHGEKFGNCVHTKWESNSDPCAPAQAPREVEVTPPPAPAPQPVTQLNREQLTVYFGFNKDMLTADDKAKLDAISDAVNHSPKVTKVAIVGYTDQIGTNSYNDKLSVRRAQATKSYLDQKTRIPADVVGLRGRGEADPVVSCPGIKKRAAKIACLAKNRRVEIEFEFEK